MEVKFIKTIKLNNEQLKRKEIIFNGTYCKVIKKTKDFLQIELPSGWLTMMPKTALGTYAIEVMEL